MPIKVKILYIATAFAVLISFSAKAKINNQTLAVLVNQNDPESIEIAKYYQKKRLIPDSNIIYLNFKPKPETLTEAEFKQIEAQLKVRLPDNIQAYAIAWRKPWRVNCMSITSAISLGFSNEYCAKGCKLTRPVKYYNSQSRQPYTDFKMRPSMMLSASSVEAVKRLIDRGVSADFERPKGSAYLLKTNDRNRNVRAAGFLQIKKILGNVLPVNILNVDAIKNRTDIMFYFTGLKKVKWVNENQYLPGAIADHLTSAGGHLFGVSQMSVLKWIDAGVTGSYGTVVEPCNFLQKFPSPYIVMKKYLSGETLIESYWKSVLMPGQGVFVGEPLASPFKNCKLSVNKNGEYFYHKNKNLNFVSKQAKNCH